MTRSPPRWRCRRSSASLTMFGVRRAWRLTAPSSLPRPDWPSPSTSGTGWAPPGSRPHPRLSAAIGFEVDGVRFAHTGDQYHVDDATQVLANHVYRNGAFVDSFARSAEWLRRWRPDVLLSGHQPAMWTNDGFFDRIDEWTEVYEQMHRESMVLGEDEIHFGLDSCDG